MSKFSLKDERYKENVTKIKQALESWVKAEDIDNYLISIPCLIRELSHDIYLASRDTDCAKTSEAEEVSSDYNELIQICAKLRGIEKYEKYAIILEHTARMLVKLNGVADIVGYSDEDYEHVCFGSQNPDYLATADIALRALIEFCPELTGVDKGFSEDLSFL